MIFSACWRSMCSSRARLCTSRLMTDDLPVPGRIVSMRERRKIDVN